MKPFRFKKSRLGLCFCSSLPTGTVLEAKDSETHEALSGPQINGESVLQSTDYKTSEDLEDPESDLAAYSIQLLSIAWNELNEGLQMLSAYTITASV